MNPSSQWLLFRRGRQGFAVAADALVCQLSAFACAVLPDAPAGIVGLFSFAGEALPMLDMAAVAGDLAEPTGNCLIISIDAKRQLGLLSDDVAVLTNTVPEQDAIVIDDKHYKLLNAPVLIQLLAGAAD
ncbi:MAG: chemotaxis protein CheW [Methylophaga sp.]